MNLSEVILRLERIARETENNLISREMAAQELAECGEDLFRLSTRVRHSGEGV